jgi:hypothetical protein
MNTNIWKLDLLDVAVDMELPSEALCRKLSELITDIEALYRPEELHKEWVEAFEAGVYDD